MNYAGATQNQSSGTSRHNRLPTLVVIRNKSTNETVDLEVRRVLCWGGGGGGVWRVFGGGGEGVQHHSWKVKNTVNLLHILH